MLLWSNFSAPRLRCNDTHVCCRNQAAWVGNSSSVLHSTSDRNPCAASGTSQSKQVNRTDANERPKLELTSSCLAFATNRCVSSRHTRKHGHSALQTTNGILEQRHARRRSTTARRGYFRAPRRHGNYTHVCCRNQAAWVCKSWNVLRCASDRNTRAPSGEIPTWTINMTHAIENPPLWLTSSYQAFAHTHVGHHSAHTFASECD